MPIANIQDTTGVEQKLQEILSNGDVDRRLQAIRELFVGILDYDNADQLVSLESAGNAQLPKDAYLAAHRDGVTVAYIPLDNADTNRVNGIVVSAAAKALSNILADDLLLVFTNRDRDQLHIISPDLSGNRPKLQRLVAYRDQLQRTVPEQIAKMWDNYGNKGRTLREAIAEAFNVEPVTKEFFQTYRWLFEEAKEQITGFTPAEEEQKHLFTQTLFNRLMFVYFLSRKGWLKFDGNTDYLKALWTNYDPKASTGNFYLTRLRTLFFNGLNNPDAGNLPEYEKALIGEVPFLNGGLFEETDLDKHKNIEIPDETIGHILADLFDRFNFTVMESTPYDVEVAVDPEMLGKVFEELVTGRHDSGAYYTPRPVVSFMCREALKGYLEGKETGLDADAITRFVDEHDTSGISLIGAPRVSEALSDVTVVDPACGSGAYLLGIMQELIELQTILYNIGVDAKKIYDLKLEIIQRNLYGADIDEFAVNIAMLRMWLSLAIDFEGEDPEPLPNLDFKVVCGDSLLGPDPSTGVEVQGTLGRDVEKIQRLGQLKASYMRAYSGLDKARFKAEIEELSGEIRKELGNAGASPGVVDWQVEFAEVFFQRQGFDIAIANPPYIQLQKDGGRLADLYRDTGFQTLSPRGDIYQLFYERGCQLLTPSRGLLAYITSNSWLRADYGKPTRAYLSGSHTPLALLELGKDVFASAIVDSGILLLRSGGHADVVKAVDMDKVRGTYFPPDTGDWGEVRMEGSRPWSVLSRLEQRAMDRMTLKGTPLKDWGSRVYRGVTTGLNEAFIIDDETRNKLVATDPKSDEIIKPVLRGRDIKRFRSIWTGTWVIVAKFGSYKTLPKEYPAVYKHLLQHEGKLRARGQCRYSRSRRSNPNPDYEGQHHWLELDNNPRNEYLEEFAKEKLIWMDLTMQGRFSYDNGTMFCLNTGFLMSGNSVKYLCAVLNSSLATWFMSTTALNSGMGVTRWVKFTVETIPVPKISTGEQRAFVGLVDRILQAKDVDPTTDTSDIEWEIDQLVYDLYGLTEEESTAIERSLGLIHATDEDEDAALVRAVEEGSGAGTATRGEVLEILRAPDGG